MLWRSPFRRHLRKRIDRVWGRVTPKVLRRAARRRAQRLKQLAARPGPRPSLDEYIKSARLAQQYRTFAGFRQAVTREPGPMLEQGGVMRSYLGHNSLLAKLRKWWLVAIGLAGGITLGITGSGQSFQMQYHVFASAQVIFNGVVLAVTGIAAGIILATLSYVHDTFRLTMTRLKVYEHCNKEDPEERTGRVEMLTYRLAWADRSGRYYTGPSLESGMLSGFIQVDLPHMQAIENTDLSPYRVRRRTWEHNTPTMSLWPRVHPGYDLGLGSREVVEYTGFYPYDFRPARATWRETSDRERAGIREMAAQEGDLSKKRNRGLADLLSSNPGYTGGIVMLVIAFLLMSSW